MKIMSLHLAAILFMAVVTISSCKKNDDNSSSVINGVDRSGVNLFAALRSTPQTFSVTAGVGKKIKGAGGTILEFYPNSFKDKNGNILTSGTLEIELIEMYSVGDMIANRTSTSNNYGIIYTSGGEVNIKAQLGGQEVFANKYRIGFKASSNVQNKPMELYVPGERNRDSVTFWTNYKMGSVPGSSLVTDAVWFLNEAPYFLFDSCSTFKLINCDHPYDSTSKNVTINVTIPENTFNKVYGSLSIAFPTLNVATILTATNYNSDTHVMTFQGWVPTGPSGKISLMIAKDISNFFYYEQACNVSGDMSINANVKLLTTTELMAKLHAL